MRADELRSEIEALRAERDALLDALRQIAEWPIASAKAQVEYYALRKEPPEIGFLKDDARLFTDAASYWLAVVGSTERNFDTSSTLLAEMDNPPAGNGAKKGVVAWARPVYARPVNAPETDEGDELVDVVFHTRPEKPEGEGWYPLVVADTGTAPRINVRCETADNGITGATYLKVIRVEQEDDGSLTAVIENPQLGRRRDDEGDNND